MAIISIFEYDWLVRLARQSRKNCAWLHTGKRIDTNGWLWFIKINESSPEFFEERAECYWEAVLNHKSIVHKHT